MRRTYSLLLAVISIFVLMSCGSNDKDDVAKTTTRSSTTTTETIGDFEVAPGVIPQNNIYGNKTINEWKAEYSDIIDIDDDNNGVPDWKEQEITLKWAVNKGDIGNDHLNNLLWRHALEFAERYPNITVERDLRFLTGVTDQEALDLFVVASQENTMPDVFYSPLSAEIYDKDLSLDLTPYYRTDVEAAYIGQNLMDFNKSFDGEELVTVIYRTVATKIPSINVGLLDELNIPIPDYDWTYDEYEALRTKVGELTDAGQCMFPGIFNFSEIGPRYFDGIPGGWKGFNIESQRFELSDATNFGEWLTVEADESIEGWHFGDLTDEEKTALCGNFGAPYADGFQAIDSSVPFWSIGNKIVESYKIDRGMNIEIFPMPQAPEGGDTIMYGYADAYSLGYHLANDRVKAQAAFELVRYLSYSVEGLGDKYQFIDEDIATYGETPEDWVAMGNDEADFPMRHPYHDLIAYAEGYPATSNPDVLSKYPLIKGFDEDSWFANYNFDVFKEPEMQRQLSNIVLFPRNLPAFNNVQGELNTWRIRDQIRDEGYYYSDVIDEWDEIMNGHLDNYLQNYAKVNN